MTSSLDGSFIGTDDYSDEENHAKAKREGEEAILQTSDRRTVWILLSLTLALLIGVAVTLCVFIYKFVSDEEQEKYNVAFESQARKLLEVATSRLDERVNAVKLFSLGITSTMLASGSNWTERFLPHMVSSTPIRWMLPADPSRTTQSLASIRRLLTIAHLSCDLSVGDSWKPYERASQGH